MKAFLPEGWLLPWWVVLLVTCYLLLKAGLSLEHPCSVLGVWSPVTRGQISKRYREISMCTHPDKLLGHTLAFSPNGKYLAVGFTSGLLKVLMGMTLEEVATFKASKGCITQCSFSSEKKPHLVSNWVQPQPTVRISICRRSSGS